MYINKLVYTFKQSKNYFKDKKKKINLKPKIFSMLKFRLSRRIELINTQNDFYMFEISVNDDFFSLSSKSDNCSPLFFL